MGDGEPVALFLADDSAERVDVEVNGDQHRQARVQFARLNVALPVEGVGEGPTSHAVDELPVYLLADLNRVHGADVPFKLLDVFFREHRIVVARIGHPTVTSLPDLLPHGIERVLVVVLQELALWHPEGE